MKEIADKIYSPEEYFELVEESDSRLEYHYGRVYAMAGGNSNHSIIGNNIRRRLAEKLDRRDCVVFDSDMALSLEDGNRYVFPDGMVVCGERQYSNKQRTQLKNPVLIVEVLSEGTKSYDRTDKFRFYRSIPSLKEYLVIASDKAVVETFFKEEEGLWRIGSAKGLDDQIHLFSINIDIPLAHIYAKVDELKDPDGFIP